MPRKTLPIPQPEPGANLWDPLPGENIQWWRWFVVYRDMQPKRNLAKTAAMAGKSLAWIEKLSRAWKWRERIQAWESRMAAQISKAIDDIQDDAIEAMRKRHINMGMGMQTAAAKELQALIHKIESAAAKAAQEGRKYHDPVLTVGELIRLANEGTSMERLNRGEPTEVTRVEDAETGLDNLSKEELQQLQKLKRKLRGGPTV